MPLHSQRSLRGRMIFIDNLDFVIVLLSFQWISHQKPWFLIDFSSNTVDFYGFLIKNRSFLTISQQKPWLCDGCFSSKSSGSMAQWHRMTCGCRKIEDARRSPGSHRTVRVPRNRGCPSVTGVASDSAGAAKSRMPAGHMGRIGLCGCREIEDARRSQGSHRILRVPRNL